MRNLMLAMAFLTAFSLCSFGQPDMEVPAFVKTSFAQKFPKATKVKWDKGTSRCTYGPASESQS
jgi:hypothetical protein